MFWIYQIFDIHKEISIDGYDMLIAPLPKLTFPKVFKIKNYEIIKLQNTPEYCLLCMPCIS